MATIIDKKLIKDLVSDSETKGQKINNLETGLKRTEGYLIGIGVVTAFGLISTLLTGYSLLIESLRFKASTYQVLVDKVNKVNERLTIQGEVGYQEDTDIRLLREAVEEIEGRFTDLQKKNPYLK